MRIHALCTDRGGCFEHRIALPLAHLGRLGHDTSYGNFISPAMLYEMAEQPDSVLLGKFITAEDDTAAWEEIAALPKRPLMVYDLDDSYWDVENIYTGDRSIYAKPETIANSERVMRAADLITVTTTDLADLVWTKLGREAAVLPNAVADEVFGLHLRRPPKRFTIGYQGSPSHLLDVKRWLGAFDRTMEDTGAMWHWFGINDPVCWPAHLQLVTEWTNNPEEFHRSMNGKFHVGVAPIDPDLTFNAYKSGLKAQVYSAMGTPTVATDISYYRDTIVHGTTGYLVSTDDEWVDAIRSLNEDRNMAAAMGMRARDLEKTRMMSKVVHKWENAYRKAMS
jgi:glycosyltransferase involved in cell wall biosynthesis